MVFPCSFVCLCVTGVKTKEVAETVCIMSVRICLYTYTDTRMQTYTLYLEHRSFHMSLMMFIFLI